MQIILTLAGDHLPGSYTYRTDNQQLIGRIFTPSTREDFATALYQFRQDLRIAPVDTDSMAYLTSSSRRYIDKWVMGDGPDNLGRRQ